MCKKMLWMHEDVKHVERAGVAEGDGCWVYTVTAQGIIWALVWKHHAQNNMRRD